MSATCVSSNAVQHDEVAADVDTEEYSNPAGSSALSQKPILFGLV